MGSSDSSLSLSSCREDRVSTGALGVRGEAVGEEGVEEVDGDTCSSSGLTRTRPEAEMLPGDEGAVSLREVCLDEAFLWKS